MDRRWMLECLALCYRFKGTTSPNPTVGALLLDAEGQYRGSAVTQKCGNDHAERSLLKDIPLQQTKGGTLFVTLEPCCFESKTPACTSIIIEKKIHRVVIAVVDPNPKVSGRGIRQLRNAGIQVTMGICEREATQINQDFFYAIQAQLPFVFGKVALSLDGFMALDNGISQWITTPRSRRIGHILRYRADAILVGARTAILDNPELTARPNVFTKKPLLRIILDEKARVPLTHKVLSDPYPTIWVVAQEQQESLHVKEIQRRDSKEVFFLNHQKDMHPLLSYLYKEKQILSLMLEGGSQVFRTFLEQGYLQSLFLFYGSKILGRGLSPFPILVHNLDEAPSLKKIRRKVLSEDFLVFGELYG